MKSILRSLFLVLAALLVSNIANAATVKLMDTASSQARGGALAGFYTLKIDGTQLLAMCDDRDTHVSPGDVWTADVYGYSTTNGGGGKFGPAPVKYSQAGYLFSLAPSASATDQASIDEAIWKIMAPSVVISAAAQPYYTSATDGTHDSFDYTNFMQVVTPRPFTASQEYLIVPGQVPPASVPLPSALWLLLSGAAGLFGIARQQRSA
ncbi:MAG: VPLPA-CTERM sorting domain-containing protein [Gammaproteobacteria bacterium]